MFKGFVSDLGSSFCIDCPAGSEQPETGQSYCSYCSPGMYVKTSGRSSCVDCEAGKQQPHTGQSFCENCAYGRFKNTSGTGECEDCKVDSLCLSAQLSI